MRLPAGRGAPVQDFVRATFERDALLWVKIVGRLPILELVDDQLEMSPAFRARRRRRFAARGWVDAIQVVCERGHFASAAPASFAASAASSASVRSSNDGSG